MPRPDNLPDFTDPPLTEVVVSIQFTTPPKYSDVYVREVWALYESHFPNVQEMPVLPPAFEVFGGPEPTMGVLNVGIKFSSIRNRYWFLNDSGTELVQFQQDRFIHNWRKAPGQKKDVYPRFDTIIATYSNELATLEDYFVSRSWGLLVPNQCELTYVNQFPLKDERGQPTSRSYFFRNIDVSLDGDESDFVLNLRKPITKNGKPIGRVFVDTATGVDNEGNQVLGLNLTVRGPPLEPTRASALEFLSVARQLINKTFVTFTSDAAHKTWGRTQ